MRVHPLVGVGVLAVALVIAVVALGPRAAVSGSPSPFAAASQLAASPSSALSPPPASPSPAIAASPLPAQLASLLRPLVTSWRPTAPFLLIERSDGPGLTLVAVPIAGGAATPLVALPGPSQLGYDFRDDGSALAVALLTTATTARIAIWDLGAGTTRWLTDDEPGVTHSTPVWSEDGSLIYYAAQTYVAQTKPFMDLGIFRVRSDGTAKTRVRAPEENGAQLRGLTPDGRGLVWDRVRAGGAVEVLDLASGQNYSFDETTTASVLSLRRSQPRVLVLVGGCCAGRPGGSLALWDDTTGSSRMLMGFQSTPPVAVTSAFWEPSGTRFAAAVVDRTSVGYFGSIFIHDADGRQLAAVTGTDGAQQVMWLPTGIVFTRAFGARGSEMMFVAVSGGGAASLYQDTAPFRIRSVAGP